MKQEDKDLLLTDLCGRQMYNVKCQVFDDTKPYTLSGVLHNKPYSQLYFEELDWKEYDGFVNVEYCKPYLFPLSSMTEEIIDEIYNNVGVYDINVDSSVHIEVGTKFEDLTKIFDILHKHRIDYRGLIPMGLAIDATGLNIY